MLTADHVRARKQKGKLQLRALDGRAKIAAIAYAKAYLERADGSVGQTRSELVEAFEEVHVDAKDRKIALGLRKLVEDRCEFSQGGSVEPRAIRAALFEAATALREGLEPGETFDRDAVVAEVATSLELTQEDLERGLYADLKDAHILMRFDRVSPGQLVDSYELGQAQAVLLRALKVTARVTSRDPARYRDLFRKLKFRRLLYRIEAEGRGYRIDLDGPLSMFSAATKYGLALALLLPVLRSFDEWSIDAELAWGKSKERLTFHQEGKGALSEADEVPLVDDVERLLGRWEKLSTPWRPTVSDRVFDVPGIGCVIPDLAFTNADTGEVIYLEVMGYWSRDAVWRRVEVVQAGLPEKMLFAVSRRLRVSEAVLGDDEPSALYVFKGALQPKAILGKLDELAER